MTYEKPYPTIEDITKDKNYDYVEYRLFTPALRKDIFAGCFKVEDGKLISKDYDVYDITEPVLSSEEWSNEEKGIKHELTIIVDGNYYREKGA